MKGYLKLEFEPFEENGEEVGVEVKSDTHIEDASKFDIVNVFGMIAHSFHVEEDPHLRMMLSIAFSTNKWPNDRGDEEDLGDLREFNKSPDLGSTLN